MFESIVYVIYVHNIRWRYRRIIILLHENLSSPSEAQFYQIKFIIIIFVTLKHTLIYF